MTEERISMFTIAFCVVGACVSGRITYGRISQLVTLIKDYRRQEEEERVASEWKKKCKDSERDEDECEEDECEEGEGVDTVF